MTYTGEERFEFRCRCCGGVYPLSEQHTRTIADVVTMKDLCYRCSTKSSHELLPIRRRYGMSRIFSGPELGTLLALGFAGIIFLTVICRIVLAILVDWAHSLDATKRTNERKK